MTHQYMELKLEELEKRIKILELFLPSAEKTETVTEFADRCRECGKRYVKKQTGHWKSTIDGNPICSECGFISESLDGYFVSKYCSNCGAKMQEEENG